MGQGGSTPYDPIGWTHWFDGLDGGGSNNNNSGNSSGDGATKWLVYGGIGLVALFAVYKLIQVF